MSVHDKDSIPSNESVDNSNQQKLISQQQRPFMSDISTLDDINIDMNVNNINNINNINMNLPIHLPIPSNIPLDDVQLQQIQQMQNLQHQISLQQYQQLQLQQYQQLQQYNMQMQLQLDNDGGNNEEEEEEEEEDEEDEDEEEEVDDDDDDDDEIPDDSPSGAFANVGQGLSGKYKNLMMQYWQDTIDSIERDDHDFKVHQLPLARIKKVMKTDDEVKMISAEAPILFAKGCDIFITELTMRAWIHAEENKRRTLQKSDIAAALQKSDMFDFLIDIVPREEKKIDDNQW